MAGGGFKKVHTNVRAGKAGALLVRDHTFAKRSNCTGSAFYTAPTSGQSVDSSKQVTFSWDNSCLNPAPQYVDLYLYAPQKNSSMIQAFDSASYSDGKLQTTLDPNWWGSDASVQLQLQIVQHGANQFMSDVPAGPLWTATYDSSTAPATKSSGSPSIAQRVKNILHSLPGGSVAAAVIFPLLIVGALAFFYIRRQRKRTAAKTNRFSSAVDQRMSTINPDWQSISGAGANAAIRNSMAVRSSVFGGSDRPTSIATNQAGIGAIRTSEEKVPQMEEMARARRSVFTADGERVSRISFAPDTRSSYYEKESPRLPSAVRGLNARSFHQAQNFDEEDEHNRDLTMSPTQAAGPALLHPGDIAARASTEGEADFQREVLQMPAMTLMRTGGASDTEFVLPHTTVTPPATTTTFNAPMPAMPSPALQPNTPMTGAMPAPPAALSPDALLRAYAAGRPLASPSPGPTTGLNNGGMRVLYQNDAPTVTPQYPTLSTYAPSPSAASSATLAPGAVDNNPFRKSMAENDAVRATMYTESMYSAGAYDAYDDDAAYDTQHAHDNHAAHAYGHAQ
ncbi:hypothetical protein DL93DRAFT_1613305 [Clavulina sp. PMI_390]|nr:hypothetical protein DL93DRAFT_1613305 [Clavulina sp. PMI_390]